MEAHQAVVKADDDRTCLGARPGPLIVVPKCTQEFIRRERRVTVRVQEPEMGLEDCSADRVVAKDRYPAEFARGAAYDELRESPCHCRDQLGSVFPPTLSEDGKHGLPGTATGTDEPASCQRTHRRVAGICPGSTHRLAPRASHLSSDSQYPCNRRAGPRGSVSLIR